MTTIDAARTSLPTTHDVRRGALVRDAVVLAGRTLLHWRAHPGALAVQLLFPVLVVLMMGGLFGGAIAGSATDYMPFVVPGVLALTMAFGLETTMTAITTDAQRTVTDRFRSMPMHPAAPLLGRVLADLLTSVAELAALSVAGAALGWRWEDGLGGALLAYVLLLWLRFGVLWAGVWVGLRAGSAEAIAAVQILVWPVGFLSTAFLDPVTMPSWLAAVARWNPLSATATAIRDLFGNPSVAGGLWPTDNALLLAVALPAVLVAVTAPLAVRAYRALGD